MVTKGSQAEHKTPCLPSPATTPRQKVLLVNMPAYKYFYGFYESFSETFCLGIRALFAFYVVLESLVVFVI